MFDNDTALCKQGNTTDSAMPPGSKVLPLRVARFPISMDTFWEKIQTLFQLFVGYRVLCESRVIVLSYDLLYRKSPSDPKWTLLFDKEFFHIQIFTSL